MTKTLHAVFDGQVLRPDGPVDLQPNTRYLVTVQSEVGNGQEPPQVQADYPLTRILALATDMGVTDLASRHSSYAHGKIDDSGQGNAS